MDDTRFFWNCFERTGSVEAYLRYRESGAREGVSAKRPLSRKP